jgi:hypothetical protein
MNDFLTTTGTDAGAQSRVKRVARFIEIFITAGAALLGSGIAVADFLGVLGTGTIFGRIPTLTLLITGTTAVYLVMERRLHIAGIEKGLSTKADNILAQGEGMLDGMRKLDADLSLATQKVISSLHGIEYHPFATNVELIKHLVRRLDSATKSVDDLTWSHRLSLEQHLPTQKQAEDDYQQAIARAARRLAYRELFIFSVEGRIEKLKRRLEENIDGYSCAFYRRSEIPPFQYMIIDGVEIAFTSSVFPTPCTLRHPELAKVFTAYFDEAWKSAVPLKYGPKIFDGNVQAAARSGPK